jgi:hypothetical protein
MTTYAPTLADAGRDLADKLADLRARGLVWSGLSRIIFAAKSKRYLCGFYAPNLRSWLILRAFYVRRIKCARSWQLARS